MKNLLKITALLLLAVLCGCGGGAEKRDNLGAVDRWTVMVYMCGGNAESQYGEASRAIDNMLGVKLPANVEVLIKTGGASAWENEEISANESAVYRLQKNNILKLNSNANENMGDDKTLSDFIDWSAANFPAEHYMLVFWGEGGGSVRGIGADELFNGDSLTPDEIALAMSRGRHTFDLAIFDSSLMATLETAKAIAPYTDYMAASQEVKAGGEPDYKTVFESIALNPYIPAAQVGQLFCDTYYMSCVEEEIADTATVSLVDLSRISQLALAFDGMAGQMSKAQNSIGTLSALTRSIDYTMKFGGSSEEEGYSNMLDLGDMAVKTAALLGQTAVSVTDELAGAVIYKANGAMKDGASGLSVYYPLHQDNAELEEYLTFDHSPQYSEYLRGYCMNTGIDYGGLDSCEDSDTWKRYNDDLYMMTSEGFLNGASIYEMNISGNMDIIKTVTLDRYIYNGEVDSFFYLRSDENFDSFWEGGIFTDRSPIKIPLLNGQPVTTYLIEKTDAYSIYSVPVMMAGEMTNLRFMAQMNEDGETKYSLLYAWKGLDPVSKTAAQRRSRVSFAQKVTPLYSYYDAASSLCYHEGKPVRAGFAGLKLEDSLCGDGGYMLRFNITDIYNQHRFPDPVMMDIEDDSIIMSQP